MKIQKTSDNIISGVLNIFTYNALHFKTKKQFHAIWPEILSWNMWIYEEGHSLLTDFARVKSRSFYSSETGLRRCT